MSLSSPPYLSILLIVTISSTTGGGSHDAPLASSPASPHPHLVSLAQNYSSWPGENIKLECRVEARAQTVVVWRRGDRVLSVGKLLVRRDGKVRLTSDFCLEVLDVEHTDAGHYICEVDVFGLTHNVTHHLMVFAPPKITDWDPAIVITVGQDLLLKCEVEGSPSPGVSWRGPRGEHLGSGQSLVVKNISRQGGGNYSCHAANGLGEGDTVVSTVTLLYPPSVAVSEHWKPQGRRMEVLLECSAPALPPAQLVWVRQPGTRVTTTDRVVVEERDGQVMVLRIHRLTARHLGFYLCRAENELGGDSGGVQLTGKPHPPLFTSEQPVSSLSEYNLTWTVLSLAPVVQYHLQYRKLQESALGLLDSGWRRAVLPGEKMPRQFTCHASYSLRSLQGGRVYQVRVSAVSQYGEGEFSQLLNFYMEPAGVSPAPSLEEDWQQPILPLFSSLAQHYRVPSCLACLVLCLTILTLTR